MDVLVYLVPITFVFAIVAVAKVNKLEKEVEELKKEIKKEQQPEE